MHVLLITPLYRIIHVHKPIFREYSVRKKLDKSSLRDKHSRLPTGTYTCFKRSVVSLVKQYTHIKRARHIYTRVKILHFHFIKEHTPLPSESLASFLAIRPSSLEYFFFCFEERKRKKNHSHPINLFMLLMIDSFFFFQISSLF